MIDLNKFRKKLKTFERIDSCNFPHTFDEFWKWKTKTEIAGGHILDEDHIEETYEKLRNILRLWKAYRAVPEIWKWEATEKEHEEIGLKGFMPIDSARYKWEIRLKNSLKRIAGDYDQIRSYSLLEFELTPERPLRKIWHELGRIKEPDGKRNPFGEYFVVAITKPLMFLWGQTVAFDSNSPK